ncbi:MAG: metallophosphoesterase [Lentisphaeraceae bacterium]|nr:metallophosphoesterase [Lentisphaeraceae bacterium]
MKIFVAFIFLVIGLQAEESFKIAVLADCQYCNKPDRGSRMYSTSDQRLKPFVKECNKHDLKFAVQLGDLIDEKYESYEPILKILEGLKTPMHHVLGNHDFSIKPRPKKDVLTVLGLERKYYSVVRANYRFIILDGNDLSFHAYEKGSKEYLATEKYYKENKLKSPRYNGAIGAKQLAWVKENLEEAETKKENVILFCHFPIFPKNHHNLWNSEEVISLLEKYSCVKAYINGHNHKGNYAQKEGIHYYTLKGMVENKEPTFTIMELSKKKISVQGFGAEESREFKLK